MRYGAVYTNPKSGKFYAFYKEDENDPSEELKIMTVFDNAKCLKTAEERTDVNGKPYKVAPLEKKTTGSGYDVLYTVKVKEEQNSAE